MRRKWLVWNSELTFIKKRCWTLFGAIIWVFSWGDICQDRILNESEGMEMAKKKLREFIGEN